MRWIGLAARAAGTSNRRHESSKLLCDGHFNLLAGLLPILKETAPHVRFTKRQFAEAPTSPTMATIIYLPAR
jgi:hypothetical protein